MNVRYEGLPEAVPAQIGKLLEYKAKYPEKVGHFGELDLSAIVAEMSS